jgi:CheY-like chemotaxis protein
MHDHPSLVNGLTTTVLVIDDEPAVRQLLHRMLEPEVCRVIEAPSAEEGLRIVQAGVPPLDLVLTDLKMPGLDGWDVFRTLASYRPDLPVALVIPAGLEDEVAGRLLQKPFEATKLCRSVSTLIADARAMRARAETMRVYARQVSTRNAQVREAQEETRRNLADLVRAAWELHQQMHKGELNPG